MDWPGDLQDLLDTTIVDTSGGRITISGLLAAVLALAVAWVVSRVVRALMRRAAERPGNEGRRALLYTLRRIVQYSVMTLGVLVAFDFLGVSLSTFSLFAGAVGVGLGFGLQSVFANFIAGLLLLFDKSLKVGDFVELESGVHGEVRDVRVRATTITTNDNIDILVPNSEFVSGRVTNWTHGEASRRIRIPFGVVYGAEKAEVREAALEAAAEVPYTLSLEGPRQAQVWLVEFGDSALKFELVVWLTAEATKRPGAARAAYNWALHSALQRHGIEIPFPQVDVNVRSLFGLEKGEALDALDLTDAAPSPPERRPRPVRPVPNDAATDAAVPDAGGPRGQGEGRTGHAGEQR
jgi:small-conductance mechanosensitive channel